MAAIVRQCVVAGLVFATSALLGGRSQAALVDYTFTTHTSNPGISSARLDGVDINYADVSIIGRGDTANITGTRYTLLSNALTSVTVAINGVESARLAGPYFIYIEGDAIGIRQGTLDSPGPDLLNLNNRGLSFLFNLDGVPPTVGGTSSARNDVPFATTTGGSFSFTGFFAPSPSFFGQVQPSAVPEPSSLVLSAVGGLVGLAGFARRRRRSA